MVSPVQRGVRRSHARAGVFEVPSPRTGHSHPAYQRGSTWLQGLFVKLGSPLWVDAVEKLSQVTAGAFLAAPLLSPGEVSLDQARQRGRLCRGAHQAQRWLGSLARQPPQVLDGGGEEELIRRTRKAAEPK